MERGEDEVIGADGPADVDGNLGQLRHFRGEREVFDLFVERSIQDEALGSAFEGVVMDEENRATEIRVDQRRISQQEVAIEGNGRLIFEIHLVVSRDDARVSG